MYLLIRLALILTLAAALAGCEAPKRTDITGTITRGGKPLEWTSDGGHLLVIFVPEDRKPNQDPYLAESDRATGTYRIPVIPAGRYRVAVHQFDEHHQDALQNKFDPFKTTLVYEVREDGEVIDIDLPAELP